MDVSGKISFHFMCIICVYLRLTISTLHFPIKTKNSHFCIGSINKLNRFTNLVKRFGSINWRFSDTHGEMMSLKTYAKYISNVEGKSVGQ